MYVLPNYALVGANLGNENLSNIEHFMPKACAVYFPCIKVLILLMGTFLS